MSYATAKNTQSRILSTTSAMLALSSLLLSSIMHTTNAQDAVVDTAEPTICSCSPTVFTFVLSFNQTCANNDIQENAGIEGSFCFTEEDVTVPEAPAPGISAAAEAEAAAQMEDEAVADGPVRRALFRELQEDAASGPVAEVVSVQFLEFDTSGDLTVINQDDTYVDVALFDGDTLEFASATSFLDTNVPLEDQTSSPALVAGGASLILYGRTETGQVVRNRFFWMYDMNCGLDNEPIKTGDEIGWVTVDKISNAWPTFCPALPEGSPTIAPKSNEPTISPSVSPIRSPTTRPTSAPASHITDGIFSKSSKSSKAKTLKTKTAKSAKSSKSKSGKSKSSKSLDSSADGQNYNVMGKATKHESYKVYDNTATVKGYDVERANSNSASSISSVSSGLGLVMMLVSSYLFSTR